MKKKLLPLLLTAVMALTACSGGADVQDAMEPEPEPKQYSIGEMGTGEHYNITLLGGETTDEVPIGRTLSDFAMDGKVYLLLALELENITDEEQNAKMWDVTFVVDGREVSHVNLAPEVEIREETYHRMGDETTMAPGEAMEVYAATEIPEDWQSCEFTYDGVTFVVSAQEATPPPPPPAPVYRTGDEARTEHYNVTLATVTTMKEVPQYGSFYFEAQEGYTFLILLLEIENITDETLQLWDRGNFELTLDGEEYSLIKFGSIPPDINIDGTDYKGFVTSTGGLYGSFELESGSHEVRYVAAEVPEDWNHFEITFDNAVFEGDNNQEYSSKE